VGVEASEEIRAALREVLADPAVRAEIVALLTDAGDRRRRHRLAQFSADQDKGQEEP
jgi:Arc/MetJ-type ribon-helix-helix transcriptional regulator